MRLPFTITPFAGLLLLISLLTAGSASAEPLAWNQQQVAKTTADLVHALDALLADPELQSQQATAMQQREHTAAVSSARHLRECVQTLRRKVNAGYDREESFPFWEQCTELRSDIQAYARHSWLPEATDKRANRAGDLIDTLGRYYQGAE